MYNIVTVDMNRKVSKIYKFINRHIIVDKFRVDLESNLASSSTNIGYNDYAEGYVDSLWRIHLNEYDLSEFCDDDLLNVKLVLSAMPKSLPYYFGVYEGLRDYMNATICNRMSVTIVGFDDEIDESLLSLIDRSSEIDKERDNFMQGIYNSLGPELDPEFDYDLCEDEYSNLCDEDEDICEVDESYNDVKAFSDMDDDEYEAVSGESKSSEEVLDEDNK